MMQALINFLKNIMVPDSISGIWRDFYAEFKPYWKVVVMLSFLYVADRLFHNTIRELLNGIIEEIKGLAKMNVTASSINLIGGVIVFLIIVVGLGKEIAQTIRDVGHQPTIQGVDAGTVLLWSAFMIGIYFIVCTALASLTKRT